MSRTTYTSTATYPMAVGWKCTNCGHINAKTCDIQMTASASKQGLFHSQETQDRASEQAQNQLMLRVLSIAANAEKGNYGPAFGSCVCRACSHREPWASVKANGCLVSGCFIATVVFAFFSIVCILLQDWPSLFWMLGIMAVFICIGLLSMKSAANSEKKMAPIFAQLKDIERPVIAPNADALREKMYGIIAQGPADVDVINKVVANEL